MNTTALIQNLLFNKPLIDWTSDNSKINVLVVGSDNVAQKFIDICLEVGQIPDHELTITAVSNDFETAKQNYLKDRPALNKFINVDGELNNSRLEIYANLNFKPETFLNFVADYRYIFISTDNDLMNDFQNNSVFCVRYSELTAENNSINPDLERMAFNTHLSWLDSLNVDMANELANFNADEYNKNSSMSFALSIRYKLRSIGIDDSNFERAAEEFLAKLNDKNNKKFLEKMIAYEHRRWVVEKLINGWQVLTDFENCIKIGSVKDEDQKLHPCIVRGDINLNLQDESYNKNVRRKWDNPHIDQNLDELDSMSINLHQFFCQKAHSFKKSDPFNNGNVAELEKIISKQTNALIKTAYKRYRLCLENILAGSFDFSNKETAITGSYGYSKQYKFYEKILVDSLANIPTALNLVKKIRADFFPAIECNLYRDYKYIDRALLDKIPFILTHVVGKNLALAFDDGRLHSGRNEEIFRNIASAMVINPATLTYIYYFDGSINEDYFIAKVKSILNYVESRHMTVKIKFILAINDQLKFNVDLADLKINFEVIKCSDEESAIEEFLKKLSDQKINLFDGSTMLFSSYLMQSRFTEKISNQIAYFEFDSKNKIFKNCIGCNYLNYIEDRSFIRIDDMFALNNAINNKFHFPEFSMNYNKLWNIYTQNDVGVYNSVANWNDLCDRLYEHSKLQALNDLKVRNLILNNKLIDLLKRFVKLGFLEKFNYNKATNKINFDYSTPQVKRFLTTAGEILEIYTYFKILETGYFDEAATNYEFNRYDDEFDDNGIKNEIDCIAIKGFHSVIIECKGTKEIKQDYYHKLTSIADKFGINCTKILIAIHIKNNNIQIMRGNQMDIKTINNFDEIENIGVTLQKIMEGKI